MMDKWTSLGESIPSTLKDDDFDVEPLREDDMEDPVSRPLDSEQPRSHFLHLLSLTTILAEVMDTFFTIRSSARTSTNLELSLDAAKPIRARLKYWHETLPSDLKSQVSPSFELEDSRAGGRQTKPRSVCRLDPYGSFYLAYLTVQMTLFRALLRPVSTFASSASKARAMGYDEDRDEENDGDMESFEVPSEKISGVKAVITGTLALIKEVVPFAENLSGSEWDAFWHSCECCPIQSLVNCF